MIFIDTKMQNMLLEVALIKEVCLAKNQYKNKASATQAHLLHKILGVSSDKQQTISTGVSISEMRTDMGPLLK